MYIKPYSDPSLYTAGGKCEPIAANFPSLKFWLKCTDLNPSTATVRDAISGAAPGTVSGITGNGVAFSIAAAGNINFSTLALPAVSGARVAAVFSVHNFTSGAIGSIGVNAGSPQMTVNSTSASITDGTNSASLSGMTVGALKGMALIFTPGASNQGLIIEGDLSTAFPTGTPVSSTPGALTSVPSLSVFSITTIVQPALIYGAAFMTFGAGLPGNFRAGLNWMFAQWTNNIPALPVATYGKLIYPGFKGLAG